MTPLGIPVRSFLVLMFHVVQHVLPSRLDISFISQPYNHTFNTLFGVLDNYTDFWSNVLLRPIHYRVIEENFTIDESFFFEHLDPTNMRAVVDTRDSSSNFECQAATLLNIPYIVTSFPLSISCTSTTILQSLSELLQTAVELFKDDESLSLQIITNYDFGVIIDALKTTKFATDRLLMFSLREISVNYKITANEGIPTLVIASYADIQTQFPTISPRTPHNSNHWIILPTDSDSCPENLLSYYVCLHYQLSQNQNQTRFQFLEESIYRSFDSLIQTYAKFLSDTAVNEVNQSMFANYVLESGALFKSNTEIIITRYSEQNDRIQIGSWKSDRGLYMTAEAFPKVSSLLKVVVIHEPPFVERIETDNGTIFRGYTIDVLNEIADRMGFQYTLYEVPDNQFGVKKDGKWTGIIGQVAGGFADMGAGPISVTAERENVIDFTAPYFDYAGLQILIRDPALMQSLFVFASVFTWQAWAVWFAGLFGTSFCLCLFTKWKYSTFNKKGSHDKRPRDLYFNLPNTFWFVVTSVSLAGPERSPRSYSSRLLVSGFWFFCQIIMATYTANLAAFLTSSRLESPIESLEDLATQSVYSYSVQAGTVGETYFERMANIENNFYSIWREISFLSDDASSIDKYSVWDYPLGDTYIRLWNTIQTTGMVKNSAEGIEKVLKGGYAFFHETPMIEYEMGRICGLMTVGTMFSAKPYSFVLPQNSLLLEEMSRIILKLQTETILNNLKDKWWQPNSKCEKIGEASGLSFSALGGIFIVMAAGCGLSVIILCIELATAKFRNRSKNLSQHNKTESHVALSSIESSESIITYSNSKDNNTDKSSPTF